MRRIVAVLAAGLLCGLGAPAAASSPFDGQGDGIEGSPHDFSKKAWNFRAEICRVCHVPHDHDRAFKHGLNGLLWNHAVSSATYTMYDSKWSSSLDGAQSAQPDGTAKLCLGCHDGTVHIDHFDKNSTGTIFIQDDDPGFRVPGSNYWNGNVGDLRATHPLSITYDETKDKGLAPKTTQMGGSGTIADVLDHGKVQCSSCHDVHDSQGEAVPGTHLLRVAQTVAQGGKASGLCLTCHVK